VGNEHSCFFSVHFLQNVSKTALYVPVPVGAVLDLKAIKRLFYLKMLDVDIYIIS